MQDGCRFDLFPLTSEQAVIQDAREAAAALCLGNVQILDSGRAVEDAVEGVRAGVNEWSARLGRSAVGGQTLRERLILPGLGVSGWWFGLLSERNTLKTSAFLEIAQAHAVTRALDSGEYDEAILAVGSRRLQEALRRCARSRGMRAIQVSGVRCSRGDGGVLLNAWAGFKTWVRFVLRRAWVSRALRRRGSESKRDPLLVVTYFPALDLKAFESNRFENKYCAALQKKLAEWNTTATWLLLHVPLERRGFADSVRMARRLIETGERMWFVEEFLTTADALKALGLWARQVWLSAALYRRADRAALLASPAIGPESEPIVRSLWHRSMCGAAAMEGILYSLIFDRVFARFGGAKQCLYFSEMLAWEKALNASKRRKRPDILTIGFQHGSILGNFFNYFHDPSETREGGAQALPLPDVFAANGRHPLERLESSKYPGLTEVEALRYLYLSAALAAPAPARPERFTLLVAGSIDPRETRALTHLVSAAFPQTGAMRILFKGHPALPFDDIFEDLGIDPKKAGYEVVGGDAADSLRVATATLAATSGVAIEGLVYGCEPIVPILPDALPMSPLLDFEGYYWRVSDPESLRAVVRKVREGARLHTIDEYRELVRRYWTIDPELPRWKAALTRSRCEAAPTRSPAG